MASTTNHVKKSDHPNHAEKSLRDYFSIAAQTTAHYTGHPLAFLTALSIVLIWAFTGPLFNYSDTWQLVINTGTTIVTFLMVFLIQNTQNRDSMAVQLKLSELVFAHKGAKDSHAALETMTDEELETLHQEFCQRAEQALSNLESRRAGKKSAAKPGLKSKRSATKKS